MSSCCRVARIIDFVCHEIVREKKAREASEAKNGTLDASLTSLRQQLTEAKSREAQLVAQLKASQTRIIAVDGKVRQEEEDNSRLIKEIDELTKQLAVATDAHSVSERTLAAFQKELPDKIEGALKERERQVLADCDRRIQELEVHTC
jgi:septal ring factor EnvC (AmiA/AmiB activator)